MSYNIQSFPLHVCKESDKFSLITHHFRWAKHHHLHGLIVWTCCTGEAYRGVEAVDINFIVLFENFINSLITIFIPPRVTAIEVTACFDCFVCFIRYHCMAPSIINHTWPVLSIRCFRVPQLQKNDDLNAIFPSTVSV